MWYVEMFLVSIHKGTTQTIEPLDRVITSIFKGFHARGLIIEFNDRGNLLFDWPLEEGGNCQLEDLSSRTVQHRGLYWDVLQG
jgi:hypothetical protein